MRGTPLFSHVVLVGVGLIGASLAHVLRRDRTLAGRVTGVARRPETLETCRRLALVDHVTDDLETAVADADLVVLATPVGTFGALAATMGPHLPPGCIVTDVGSVKAAVVTAVAPHLPAGVTLVPGHPVAGTEHSGPEAGFPELFAGRWCILTPEADTDPAAVARVRTLWQAAGMRVDTMSPPHHDLVLAITSHLPHLIAYTIVGTATDLEEHLRQEVIQYSAGGFRDFTRIAASDPVMWRDIFLANKEAVLEALQRFGEDLTALQRAIRRDEADTLEAWFTRTRAIRRGVIEQSQDH